MNILSCPDTVNSQLSKPQWSQKWSTDNQSPVISVWASVNNPFQFWDKILEGSPYVP